jgi:hypothetical protein
VPENRGHVRRRKPRRGVDVASPGKEKGGSRKEKGKQGAGSGSGKEKQIAEADLPRTESGRVGDVVRYMELSAEAKLPGTETGAG